MLIALLIALGVELIVVVAVATLVFGRRRWVRRQPGAVAGAIRVTSGEIDGLGLRWKRGSGHWVRDVLVWNKAPLLLTNELIGVDRISGERQAEDGEVKGWARSRSSSSSSPTAPASRSPSGLSTARSPLSAS